MNWKQAFSLGLIAPGKLFAKGEPVAYLYNGMRLPVLPEWDKSKYPYAVIENFDTFNYAYLYISEKPAIKADNLTAAWWGADGDSGGGIVGTFDKKGYAEGTADFVWVMRKPVENVADSVGFGLSPRWSNYDILGDDMVYFAATDPIPVYE